MSRVFLATERALERQVVIKVLDLEGAVDASAERFRREIKVVAQLQHPHIVPILTAGGDGTLLWYAMPFVRGESLRARLVREGALPVQDAVGIVREMLDALTTAHARGIVHRDIKPENILLEGRHAVVADFGVAKALADASANSGLTTAGVALGTPSYMAPEQALGEATTNHRADLYAVGAVFYEMLVGAPPFAGSLQAIIAAHLTAPVPSVRERRGDVPAVLQQLIERLMAKQPAERLQSAQEALTALESVTTPSGSPVSYPSVAQELRASPSGTGASAAAFGTPVRRRGMLVATVAVVAVLIAVTGAWWLNTMRESGPLAADADVIAVMPLGSTGDSTLARLGRDLVVTVSATLDGVGEVRTVDAMSVLAGTSNEANPIGLETAREIGRRLGAASVVHGSLVPEGDVVRADVGLYPTAGGDAIARLSVRAAASVAGGLTDSLASGLLRQIWRRGTPPSSLLSDVTTASTEALRLFLEGERYFESFDTELAVATYKRATAIDSNLRRPGYESHRFADWHPVGRIPWRIGGSANWSTASQRVSESFCSSRRRRCPFWSASPPTRRSRSATPSTIWRSTVPATFLSTPDHATEFRWKRRANTSTDWTCLLPSITTTRSIAISSPWWLETRHRFSRRREIWRREVLASSPIGRRRLRASVIATKQQASGRLRINSSPFWARSRLL